MKVSLKQLVKMNACDDMKDKFVETFGAGPVTVTARLVMQHALTFGGSMDFFVNDREFEKFDDLVGEFMTDFRKNIFKGVFDYREYSLAVAAAFCTLRKLPLDAPRP